jgi:hypothetical protein
MTKTLSERSKAMMGKRLLVEDILKSLFSDYENMMYDQEEDEKENLATANKEY